MSQTYRAVVKQDGEWWIGWIEEVPGVKMNRADAKKAAGKDYEELTIAV